MLFRSADFFSKAFGFSAKSGNSSVFAGTFIEALKTPYLGTKGHIAIGTNNVERAVNYLEVMGISVDMETAKYKDGKMTVVYLKEKVSGFAVHLLQK